ncbi:GNAT family N-acetyltransferase [Candidatus Soleaferrea massiliensis]|uniref:GNAT family N-acetyltransferase n=1 Tax=Candidatus Soleaferrea massiliensis TaxID=1470354 RepID=UPI00058AEB77|nr:GNAT family N-acetyltransferase [Candidatus Soleaferrea massiliensis]
MTIQKANSSDLEEVLRLQVLAYQSEARMVGSASIQPLRETLDELHAQFDRGVVLKAQDDDGVIIGSVRGYEQDGTLYIGKLMVRPDRQNGGIGSKLLESIEALYSSCRYELFTSELSEKNLTFYQRRGYRPFDERVMQGGLRFVYLEKHVHPNQEYTAG